jgi:hypothetical protein
MYYSYVEVEYVATSFSPARTDLALKLLSSVGGTILGYCHMSMDSISMCPNTLYMYDVEA